MIVIPINGVIGWDVDERSLQESLAAAKGEDVEFHFSTPGGLIGAGLGMGAQIRNYAGKTTAVITGYAMSMGSYLVQCCDWRATMDDAAYLIHNARGGVWGSDDEILHYGNYLKGLTNLLGKKLAKRSGNEVDVVLQWMKEETTFFGEDIIEKGFVDELRKTDKEIDKDLALATAMTSYKEAMALLAANENKVKEDLNRAMAMNIAEMIVISTPATAGNPKKEDKVMTLVELLSQNPAAKAEFDAAIASAKAGGVVEGKAAVQAVIDQVAPLMQSGKYPPTIGATALAVLKGEQAIGNLTAAVAAVDAVREEIAANKATAECNGQPPTSPGQVVVPATGAVVTDQAGIDAAIAAAKKEGE